MILENRIDQRIPLNDIAINKTTGEALRFKEKQIGLFRESVTICNECGGDWLITCYDEYGDPDGIRCVNCDKYDPKTHQIVITNTERLIVERGN